MNQQEPSESGQADGQNASSAADFSPLPSSPSSQNRLQDWGIPCVEELVEQLHSLANRQPAILFTINALESGVFRDRHGRSDPLGDVRNPLEQIALLAWLGRHCANELSIEIGFGTGMTANALLSGRADAGRPFEHMIFDPYGLPNQQGELAQEFLKETFGDSFQRVFARSQFGIAALASAPDPPACGLTFIDGDHQLEGVMADFFAADKLVPIGGFLVFDDAAFPPVETVINFVRHNRADYEVSMLEIPNTAVLRRIDVDRRAWDHFRPFEIPTRGDWQPKGSAPNRQP